MEYTIQKLSTNKLEISISVEGEEWNNDVKAAYEKNKYQYAFKGFRKGKVPFHIAKEQYAGSIIEDGFNYSASKNFEEIIKKENIDMVGDPDLHINTCDDECIKFTVAIYTKPEFTLGQYKGLDIEKFNTEVTDEDVQKAIDFELKKRERTIDVDRAVKDGDTVIIDYSGSVDGVKFDGGTAEAQTLVIGSNTFIPGFEPQLVGMNVGDEKVITVKFPDDYNAEELKGKEAQFAIKLHNVQEKQIPELNDDFVKEVDEVLNTVDEYKEKLKKLIGERKEKQAEGDFFNKIFDKILENTPIDLPDCMIEDFLKGNLEDMAQELKQMYNLSLDDYFKYIGKTVDDYKAEQRGGAIRQLKLELVMGELIKTEKIEPSEEEFKAEMAKIPEGEMSQQRYNQMINELMLSKLIAFLKENNNLI